MKKETGFTPGGIPKKTGRGVNLCPVQQNQHPNPLPHPHRSRRMMMIQQQSPLPWLQPQLLPQLFPPQRQSRMMIQIILQQFPPQLPIPQLPQPLLQPQLLSHPQPVLSSPHPQFVAAKSLMLKSSKFCLHSII